MTPTLHLTATQSHHHPALPTITTSHELAADPATGNAVITYNGGDALTITGNIEAVEAFAKAFRRGFSGKIAAWSSALLCDEPAATADERLARFAANWRSVEFDEPPAEPWFVALLKERHEAAAALA